MPEPSHNAASADARDPVSSVVLFGHGRWGRNLSRHLRELGVLRAVIDPTLSGRTLGDGVHAAARFEELSLDLRASLSAAVIATPAHSHAAEAQAALRAGLDVLVEKPFATSARQARDLVAEARGRSQRLVVGHQLLSHPGFLGLRQLIESGELGSIHHLSAERHGRGRRRPGEDVLLSFAPHDLSMIAALVAGPAGLHLISAECEALKGGPDRCHFRLDFPRGVRAEVSVDWNDATRRRRISVTGTRAQATFDELDAVHPLRVFDASHPEGRPIPVPKADALRAHLQHFLEGREVGANADAALRVTDLIEELRDAARRYLSAAFARSRRDRMRSSSSVRAE
jgi:UDP-2-acetamido-3-amino-2,3-dideoxy-glucuronate N-acetyltransferase